MAKPGAVFKLARRFEDEVQRLSSGCWTWGGEKWDGYRRVWALGREHLAHRLVYELVVGPVAEGLHLDHLCRNRGCCNPRHLEPVTCGENLRRGVGLAAVNAAKTHCSQGHPFEGDNLRQTPTKRCCRACERASSERNRRKRGMKPAQAAPHGITRYQRHGCRCATCRRANADKSARQRRNRKAAAA